MNFENESTFVRMSKENKQEEFHKRYEAALKDVEKFLGKEYLNIIGKEVVEKEKIFEKTPIDGKNIGIFQAATRDSVDKAIEMLKKSYHSWYSLGYVRRTEIMLKAANEMSKRKFEISAVLAYENGKTRSEAVADLDEAIDFMRYYSLNLVENQGFIKFTGKGYDNEESRSVMKPYGIFAVIAPFNFYAISVGMVCGPLITGNSVIFKPSSNLLISSHIFVNILYDCGVPREVLAYLSGKGSEIGPYIVSHKAVSGILFTGSRDAGIDIYRKANAEHPKIVITEMGGKDAIIVTDNANLDKAVNGVYRATFGYSGQK
ncbi:delta-1-pyrroline-5-carboxylate dehydrogenase, partial [mine drainage metagenome]